MKGTGIELEKRMNLRKTLFALSFAVMLAVSLPLRAQTGCEDSPEDPTIVLALIGGAGALSTGLWRARHK